MQRSLWSFFKVSGILIFLAAAVFRWTLHARVGTSDFKSIAEAKVGEFLRAKVHVAKIRLGFLNQIALSGLEILPDKKENPYQIEVRRIVFRYDFWQLFSRHFQLPASVILHEPKIVLKESGFPYVFFRNLQMGQGRNYVSALELVGGEVTYDLSGDSRIVLKGIRGNFISSGNGILRADISAEAEGIISGHIQIRGEIDTVRGMHRLKLELKSVNLNDKSPIPLEDIHGRMRWEDDDLFFDEIHGSVHGWETFLKGRFINYSLRPELVVDWASGKKKQAFHLGFKADFATQRLNGKLKIWNQPEQIFQGNIRQDASRLMIDRLKVNNRYDGKGRLDFSSGDSQFDFKNGEQNFSIATNLKKLSFDLGVHFNHMNILGVDVVTSARLNVIPSLQENQGHSRPWKFKADFKTDYFILEYTPFEDFRGSFEIDAFGMKKIAASWGQSFEMNGAVLFRSRIPEAKFNIKVNDFDLRSVREFAAKPLPAELGGMLEGKLQIEGPVDKPELTGNFSVKDGKIGKLDYERASIHFRGFPPYLPLEDSSILKGRTALYLMGAINLSLPNMFHGIQIQTADKIVIWRGWIADTNHSEGDLEISSALGRFPALAFKTGSEKNNPAANAAEKTHEESYVGVGPKLKF